jgi:signal transduction histidine kinase
VDDGYLAQKMEEWTARKAEAEERLCWFVALLVLSALSFVFLASVAGRVPGTEGGHASRTEAGSAPQTAAGGAPRHGQGLRHDRGVRMRRIDRWYTDLNAAVVFLLGLFLTLAWADIQGPYMKEAAALVFSLIAVPLLLSLARHLKNRTLFTHTLIFTVVRKIVDGIRHVYNSGSIGMKIVLLAVGYPIVVAATFFMFPVTMGAAAWLGLKKARSFTEIMRGVERIRNGDIRHKIRVEGRGELAQLADHINGIAEGLRKAVDSELRSERLKTELITNVSHDLRTPLTSIITYIDLLKREQDPARAKEYVEVLDQKAQKLKMLTDGLFEAAKASSGNIPVEMKDLDIVSLIRQGLGELNNEVEKSGLQFRLNVPGDKVMVRADGALLWRAIENLLSNIFKYALKGSRVYIDVEDTEGRVEVTFKNISSQELNMPAEELMERFTRGDESRSSEGSGLGLNIAKSLIELMQGRLHIDIDGDLFKARIVLPKSE